MVSIIFVFLAGCSDSRPGRFTAAPAPAPLPGQIYLIRGFADWYSDGLDTLARDLRGHGLDAQTCSEAHWEDLASHLLDERARDRRRPLVLIGFSWGADDVIAISRTLAERDLPVDLLIAIDPVTPDAVPANVSRCVNFYEPNGVWDVLPFLRGIPLQREDDNADALDNVNVRHHADLIQPGTSHATIASNRKIHRAIVALVLQACAGERRDATQPLQ